MGKSSDPFNKQSNLPSKSKRKHLFHVNGIIFFTSMICFPMPSLGHLDRSTVDIQPRIDGPKVLNIQVDSEKQQIHLVSRCTPALGLYAVVQSDRKSHLFVQSAMGLQMGAFSLAYQMDTLGKAGDGHISLRWSKRFNRVDDHLVDHQFYSERFLRWEDRTKEPAYSEFDVTEEPTLASTPLNTEALNSKLLELQKSFSKKWEDAHEERLKLWAEKSTQLHLNEKKVHAVFGSPDAAVSGEKRMLEAGSSKLGNEQLWLQRTIYLPGSTLSWDETGRYLSVKGQKVHLNWLASELAAFPQIDSVQVCTEELVVESDLIFPCSLEICYRRPVLERDLDRLGNSESESESPVFFVNEWQIQGSLAWYAPHEDLILSGSNLVKGNTVFCTQSLSIFNDNLHEKSLQGLHVQGSLCLFKEPFFDAEQDSFGLRGVFLGMNTQLTAHQVFVKHKFFFSDSRASLAFLKGGIILAERGMSGYLTFSQPEAPERVGEEARENPKHWIRKKDLCIQARTESGEKELIWYADRLTPVIALNMDRLLREEKLHVTVQDQSSREDFFNCNRVPYFDTNCLIVHREKLNALISFWHIVCNYPVLQLFVDQQTYNAMVSSNPCSEKDKTKQRGYFIGRLKLDDRPIEEAGVSTKIPFLGIFLELQKNLPTAMASPSLKEKVVIREQLFNRLEKFLTDEFFFPEGMARIGQLNGELIAPYSEAARQWSLLKDPFFNKVSFHCLIGPFLHYHPFDPIF